MKIIKRGTPPSELVYQTNCGECRSVLEFQKHECHIRSERNETAYILQCPVCRKEIWMNRLTPITPQY